jgi:uncharacterized protein (TIGR01777 family)
MDAMKVVIAGGAGYIGTALASALVADGAEVVVLSRRARADRAPGGARMLPWDPPRGGGWTGELRGAGAVVNLAGENIGEGRWSAGRKRAILESRLQATGALVDAILELPQGERPEALVNASGVDCYGDVPAGEVDETSPGGEGFLAGVVRQWEAAARRAENGGVRVVLVRTAPVLSRTSPTLRLMALPFRLFAGGPVGGGRQPFSWIHLDDLVGIYRLAIRDRSLSGPINAAAPEAPTNEEVAREIGRALRRPALLPAPAPMLRLVLGEKADLVLQGRRARPRVALAHGFTFRYPTLAAALQASLGPAAV